MTRPANLPPTCPFGDGRHKPVVTRWGRCCPRCSQTWQWRGNELVPTWDIGVVIVPRGCERISLMTIEEAVSAILGDEVARAIILEMGVHWAVPAAMAAATTDDDPRAIAAINRFNAEQKALLP